jgi:formamidopyrimidine-DNA glycosylase
LPEVEHLRRSLAPVLVGARVRHVELRRRDILRDGRGRRALLLDGRIAGIHRHGKQLALEVDDGRVLCVQLGMTGRLIHLPAGVSPRPADHVHCAWRIERRGRRSRLVFRDPRRFGSLGAFPSLEALRAARWDRLGPDALDVGREALATALAGRHRPIKAALLDQAILAGVGNIYADEALHAAGLHPLTPSAEVPPRAVTRLRTAIVRILSRAVEEGGSTIRDWSDGTGRPGSYASRHRVYGRAGLRCPTCGTILQGSIIAQRSTTHCPSCQRPPP